MRNAQAVVKSALDDAGVENSAVIARKVLKRLAAHRGLMIAWLCDIGAMTFGGYATKRGVKDLPTRVYKAPFTRDDVHVYFADGEVVESAKGLKR